MNAALQFRVLLATMAFTQSLRADLFNVDFGSGQPVMETGFAATGKTTNDYWNFYNTRNPDGSFKPDGSLENLTNSVGVPSSVGLTVSNGAGGWNTDTSDPMYNSYIYPLSGVNLIVTITNLPPGFYNFYLYSHDSVFNLKVGGKDFGTNGAYNYPIAGPPPWVRGRHYAAFGDAFVGSQQAAIVTVSPGQINPAVIAGMQIESIYCSPHKATARAIVVNGFVVDATIIDGGCGYTNTPTVLIQGGSGVGAAATAVVSGGYVTSITITDAGIGYTNAPIILIDSPPFAVQTELIKSVRPLLSGLMLNSNYQLQVSVDMKFWTNNGPPFIATNTSMIYPEYFDVNNFYQLFFRAQVAP
jgi:hypothetical protein